MPATLQQLRSHPRLSLQLCWHGLMPDAPLGTAARTNAQTLEVPAGMGMLRTFLRVLGPGYLVAVGYMDPGTGLPTWRPAPSSATACCG